MKIVKSNIRSNLEDHSLFGFREFHLMETQP